MHSFLGHSYQQYSCLNFLLIRRREYRCTYSVCLSRKVVQNFNILTCHTTTYSHTIPHKKQQQRVPCGHKRQTLGLTTTLSQSFNTTCSLIRGGGGVGIGMEDGRRKEG